MAKRNYKSSESDSKKLRNLQRQYNRKIEKINDKLESQFELEKVSIKELKNLISNKKDYKTVTSYLEAALKPNATKISKTYGVPNVVVQQTKRIVTLANRENTRRRKEVIKILEKQGVKITDNEMGHPELKQYRNRQLTKGKSPKEIIKFKQSLERQARGTYDEWRNTIYKSNYETVIFNPRHVDPHDARKIYEIIGDIDNNTFYELAISRRFSTIEYAYEPIDHTIKGNNIISEWQNLKQTIG